MGVKEMATYCKSNSLYTTTLLSFFFASACFAESDPCHHLHATVEEFRGTD